MKVDRVSTIVVSAAKGGVGKTTTAIALAACFKLAGTRVLLIELDKQTNLPFQLGQPKDKLVFSPSLYEVMDPATNVSLEKAIHSKTRGPLTYDFVPARFDLDDLIEPIRRHDPERWMYRLVRKIAEAQCEYDLIILDCPPNVNEWVEMATLMGHMTVVPIKCEYATISSLELQNHFYSELEEMNDGFERNVVYLLTMKDPRGRHGHKVESVLRRELRGDIFETVVHMFPKVAEAAEYGQPIVTWLPEHDGSRQYREVAAAIEPSVAAALGVRLSENKRAHMAESSDAAVHQVASAGS